MKLCLTENSCYLENAISGIRYIRIEFAGSAIIEDTTPMNCLLYLYKSKVNIFIKKNINIEHLFKYRGKMGIQKANIILNSGKMRQIKVINKKYEYLSQNISTKSEDMSLLSEEMNQKRLLKVSKTKLKNNFISNINPKRMLFNKDGTNYEGLVHRVLDGPNALHYYSGGTPSKDSKLLYGIKRNKLLKPSATTRDMRNNYLTTERSRNKKNVIY